MKQDGNVGYWDLETAQLVRPLCGHDTSVRATAFLTTNMLASGSEMGCICIHDQRSADPVAEIQAHAKCVSGLVVGDYSLHSCSWDGHVKLWDQRYLYLWRYGGTLLPCFK